MTFSGVKWPPFRWSEGHWEEAGFHAEIGPKLSMCKVLRKHVVRFQQEIVARQGTWNLDGWNWVRNSSENQVFVGTIVALPTAPTRRIGWMKPCQEIVVVNMPLPSLTTPCLPCSHLITEPEAIMKSMDHPNIIKLFETFEDRKHIYLVAWQSNDITSNQNVMRWWCRVTWG